MTMEDKIDSLMDSFVEMKEKVDTLMEMKEIVTTMQKDIKELRQDHENMNRTLILIEDDTSNKIPALFDGYSFQQKHIEEDEKRLDVLEKEVDNHSIRISVLEQAN